MKKLLLLSCLFISLISYGQTTNDDFGFFPYFPSRAYVSDSTQIQFIFHANSTVSGVSVVQKSGPTIKINPVTDYSGNANTITHFWVAGLQPGVYSFQATAKVASGGTAYAVDSLTILPDRVCPVIPPARTVVSFSFPFFGSIVTIPLPATGVSVKYSDGTTQ